MLVEYGVGHILPEVDQLRLLQLLTDERPDDQELLFADIRARRAVSWKEMTRGNVSVRSRRMERANL